MTPQEHEAFEAMRQRLEVTNRRLRKLRTFEGPFSGQSLGTTACLDHHEAALALCDKEAT